LSKKFLRVGIIYPKLKNNYKITSLQSVFRQMQQHQRNCPLAVCEIVAEQIVKKYPASFVEVDDEGHQLGCRLRSHSVPSKTSSPALNPQKRGRPSTFGCLDANPDIPLGETDESLEGKRQLIAELYRTLF
jgi:hypothetical protein